MSYICTFVTVFGSGFLLNAVLSLDPPGGDTVAKLRRDLESLNGTLAILQAENSDLKHKNVALEQKLNALNVQNKPNVAFSVSLSRNVQLGSDQVIRFDKILTNIGDGYNKYHGQFTSPVAGLYYFYFTVISATAHGTTDHLHVQLLRNGVEIGRAFSENNVDAGSGAAVVHLEVGDVVWLKHKTGLYSQMIEGDSWSSFTGMLIQ